MSIRLEYAFGAIAVVVAVNGLAVLIRASIKRTFDWQGWLVMTLTVGAGFVAATSRRRETSGVNPAVSSNIGGLIVEAWPIAVSALVAGAVGDGAKRRQHPGGRRR